MAEYKVIQDVEAEDKLIGPLTLKQFIFACVAFGAGFLGFVVASKTSIVAFIPFLPFIIVPGVLATPIGKDQPTDVWLAAKIRFLIKPRKRIWDQNGAKNLLNITAPKKVTRQLTNNLDQQQVKSRLQALSDVIDTHGWAAKSADLNLYAMPVIEMGQGSDRLIDLAESPKAVPDIDITAADDILDAQNNTTAQQFDSLVKNSSKNQRQATIAKMKKMVKALESQKNKAGGTSSKKQEQSAITSSEQFIVPHQNTKAEQAKEEELLTKQFNEKHKKAEEIAKLTTLHHKSIRPLTEAGKSQPVTPLKNPDIVNLANTDLKIATIAGLVNRKNTVGNGETTVNLR